LVVATLGKESDHTLIRGDPVGGAPLPFR
ncbi:hypothetical protein A2U01_0097730, partial [Trifolium medium]|nr:hypothetical protein [Trifolium medium]